MKNHYFETKTLLQFLKSEFGNRKNSGGFFSTIISFISLFPIGILNFKTQKEWCIRYKAIEKSIVNFYPELNCEINSENPRLMGLSEHLGTKRIGFEFNKTHVAITSDTLFFFPYDEPHLKPYGLFYNTLQESFRIEFKPKAKHKNYQENKNLKFISIEHNKEKTTLTFKIAQLKHETEFIFDQKITIDNSV